MRYYDCLAPVSKPSQWHIVAIYDAAEVVSYSVFSKRPKISGRILSRKSGGAVIIKVTFPLTGEGRRMARILVQWDVMDGGLCIHPTACESFSGIAYYAFLPHF